MAPQRRRLVNEYQRMDDGSYVLAAHDVELAKYLHGRGYRILVARSRADFSRYAAGAIPPQQSTNHVWRTPASTTTVALMHTHRQTHTHTHTHRPSPLPLFLSPSLYIAVHHRTSVCVWMCV
jgi:hypothetical protein